MEAGAGTGGICAGGDLCTESYGCVEHDGFPQCDHSTGFDWVSFRFTRPLENPVVVSSIQSHTGNDWCKTRQRSVSNDGFNLKVEEDGLDVGHNTEMFGWVAITAGTGRIAGTVYEAIVTPDAVTHDPYDLRFSAGFRSPPGLFKKCAWSSVVRFYCAGKRASHQLSTSPITPSRSGSLKSSWYSPG